MNAKTRQLRRRLLRAGLLVVVISVVTLCGGEGLLRFYVWCRGWTPNCYAASLELFRPNERLGNDLKPHFRLRSGTFVISTNSLGLRGPDISRRKPDGLQRVALLGGSSAFGYLVSDGEEAARLLEMQLRAQGLSAEVINGGVPGYNLYQTVSRYQTVIAPLQPDVVVLYLGYNDWPYIVSDVPDHRRFRVRPIAPAWERLLGRSTLYGLVAYRLLGSGPRFTPGTSTGTVPTPAGAEQFRANLNALAAAIRESGAQLVVCSQVMVVPLPSDADAHPRAPSDIERPKASINMGQWLHDSLQLFAEQHDARFIDAYSEIRPTKTVLGDAIHLTAEGEQQLADLLAERLLPALLSHSQRADSRDLSIPKRSGGTP